MIMLSSKLSATSQLQPSDASCVQHSFIFIVFTKYESNQGFLVFFKNFYYFVFIFYWMKLQWCGFCEQCPWLIYLTVFLTVKEKKNHHFLWSLHLFIAKQLRYEKTDICCIYIYNRLVQARTEMGGCTLVVT